MDARECPTDLVGAWALDACEPDEKATVEAHLGVCRTCAALAARMRSAAGWLGPDQVAAPPSGLRAVTLARARARRAPDQARTLVGAYAAQVTHLGAALGMMATPDWRRPDPRHNSLGGVIVHLAANDANLASDLGLPVTDSLADGTGDPGTTWRSQATILLGGLSGAVDLDHPVRMAGAGAPVIRPLRDALVQRAFETWIHLEDVGAALGLAQPRPPAQQLRRIVDLAVALLPGALAAHGMSLPGWTGRLALSGPAAGEWSFPLDVDTPADLPPAFVVAADATDIARLVARRVALQDLAHTVTGDHDLADRVLRVAATLGCD